MKRILSLILLSSLILVACGSPIVDKSHEKDYGGAEKKAEKAAGGEE